MCESTALVPASKPVMVVARPHPLSRENVSCLVPAGLSVAEIVGNEARNCRIEIGGVVIIEAWWSHVRPKPGTIVQVTRFPQGGGGGGWKMIFRLIAFAALAVVTYGIATGVAWMPEAIQGLSAGMAALTAAAVGIGGSLLISALIPPAAVGVGQQTSPTALKGISGVQNAADPYGAITCVFGTMLVYPKLASRSYTELSGNDQYVRALFDLGYGLLSVAQEQIGTDPLSNFTGVQYEIGPAPDLFTQDILEIATSNELDTDGNVAVHATGANADEGSLDLIFPSGLFGADNSGNNVTATCHLKLEFQIIGDPSVSEGGIIAIPLGASGLYGPYPANYQLSAQVTISGDGAGAAATAECGVMGSAGYNMFYYGVRQIVITNSGHSYTEATASIQVNGVQNQPAIVGMPVIGAAFSNFTNIMSAAGLSISNYEATSDGTYLVCASSERQTFRVGVHWKFPQRGQYTVRVTRYATDFGSVPQNNRSGNLQWSVLRTIRYAAPSSLPTTKLAMRIQATDQLNGTVSQFNLLVSQNIPVWNGAAWVTGISSNPAWLFRWVLKDCPANPRPVDPSRIDDDGLKEWGAECDAKGFSFNYTNDNVTTVFALLQVICACGRASFTVVDGKYSVVRDVSQNTPVQIFSPRNTSNFQGTRAFVDVVHALRVQFVNPQAGYQQDELIVYDDGFDAANATKFEQLQIPGCANAPMAWKLGRYHLAVARLRPNTYSWTTDVEHLICNRGDLVYFASDVIAVGLGWGRVKSIMLDGNGNVTQLTVDEPQVITDNTKTYAMRFRCQDGTAKTSVVTFAGQNPLSVATFVLSAPTPGINPGDLFLFGVQGQDSVPMIINKIEPTTDLAAKLTAVDAAPAVLTADAGFIDSTGTYTAGLPPLISSITGQPWVPNATQPTFALAQAIGSGTTIRVGI